jgi:two-component system sensor histidine kinase SenX3
LGLAIVKHICANHGGECTVWSRLGEGSTFTLRFPAYLNGAGHTMEEALA